MKIKSIILAATLALFTIACTDLDEEVYSLVPASEYGKTSTEIKTIAGSAYASLRGFKDDISISYPTCEYVLFLVECVSDEACIPTRGTDWYDNGRYQEAQIHDLKPDNAMVLSAWRYCYTGITACNFVIYAIEEAGLDAETEEKAKAEVRGVRAYYYYLLLDWFGNVPITTSFTEEELPANSTRQQVYEFIESELTDIRDNLQTGIEYGRFTQNVCNTLLARLYINSEAFIGTTRWQDCIDACDLVTGYELESDIFNNFLTENEGSTEIIFAIPYDHTEGTLGNYLNSMSLHYNQRQAFSAESGGWQWSANGICAQPGVYSSFEEGDERIDAMREGIQYSMATGEPILMDNGEILNYTESIENYTDALQNEGVRLFKYEVRADEVWERDHDLVIMRYAEVMMMKAECLVRLNNSADARSLVQEIRERAGLTTTPDPITLEVIDQEWLHEFLFEGIRRSVNIRFGTYFQPWWAKPNTTPTEKAIFPIPETELEKNSNLEQNPGY